jgi:hypothetical protein
MSESTKNLKLTQEILRDKLDESLENKLLWDVGVTINRTNAVPLDLSSTVFPAEGESAEAAAERTATESPIAHPGQILTVVESKDVTPFVVQTNTHTRTITTLDEDSQPTVEIKDTQVEQLAYKSYVDELTTDLKHTIGNLNSVMNFRGTFETFTKAQEFADSKSVDEKTGEGVAFVPGDIIIITGTANPEDATGDEDFTDGKPGMEYVCTSVDENGKATWKELGFGSQITTFIGGDTGLVLPTTQTVGKGTTTASNLVGYITESDKAITTFVGSADESTNPKLLLPDEKPWKEATTSTTILDYIQESDKVITDHIGTEATDGTFKLPEAVPYDDWIPDDYKNPETVLDYIQTADQSIKAKLEGILDAERKARRLTDTDIANFIGTEIGIQETLGDTEGDTGNSLQRPTKYFDTTTQADLEANTVFGYIQKSDTMLADLIGAKTEANIKDELLPSNVKATESNTVLKYIQDSDKTITDFIGTESTEGVFSLPETVPGNQATESQTVLSYVQESDKAITDYLGSEAATTFKLPDKLPDLVTDRTADTNTVLKYIKAADHNIIDVLGVEKANDTYAAADGDGEASIIAFSLKDGETVAERLTDTNIQVNNLKQFVGYQALADYEQPSLQERITGLDDLTEKASKNLIFEELDSPGQCKVVGVKEGCLEAVIYVPRMDQAGNLVTTIATRAFANQPNIQRIILPESIKVIENYAFIGSANLADINLPNGLTTIGESAFSGCSQLKEIYIPASCVNLGTSAFRGCTSLTRAIIDLYNPVRDIAISLFEGCTALEHVELPWHLLGIGVNAFSGCTGLKTLYLGNDIQTIATGSFDNCTALATIYCISNYIGGFDCENAAAIFAAATIHPDTQPEKFTINEKIDRKSREIHAKLDSIAIRTSEGEGSIKLNDTENNRAVTKNSFAGGSGTIADETEGQFVVGTYNAGYTPPEDRPEVKALFVVGNGTDDEHRANAMVVDTEGITELKGLRVQGDIEYAGDLSFDNLKARSVKSDRLEISGEIIAEDIDLSAKMFQANSAKFIDEAFAPTLALGTDDDRIATTAFVQATLNKLVADLIESQPVEIGSISVKLKNASKPLTLSNTQQITDEKTVFTISFTTARKVKNIQLSIDGQAVTTTWTENSLTWTSPEINYNLLNVGGTHTIKITVTNIQGTQPTSKSISISVGRRIYFGSIPVSAADNPAKVSTSHPYTTAVLDSYKFSSELRVDGSRKSSSAGQYTHYTIKDSGEADRVFCYLVPYVCDANNKVIFALPNPESDFSVSMGLLQMIARLVLVDSQPYILYYPEQNPGESLDVNIFASIKNVEYTFS